MANGQTIEVTHKTIIGGRIYALVLDYEKQSSMHSIPMSFHRVCTDGTTGKRLSDHGKLAGQIYQALKDSL